MKRRPAALATLFALACTCTEAGAAESPCSGEPLSEAKSLESLPNGLLAALGANRPGSEGVADRNREFNKSDVVKDDRPMRRFALAAVGKDCSLVALERGGRGYFVELQELRRNNAGWQVSYRNSIGSIPPRSVQELVLHAKN